MIKSSNGEQSIFSMKKIKVLAGLLVVAAAVVIGIGYKVSADTVYQPSALFDTQLSQAMQNNTSTVVMTLQNGTDGDGNLLNGNYCFTVDGGLSNVEYVCGNASGSVISNLIRGVSFTDGTVTYQSHMQTHRIGADVKITDEPYLSQYARILNGVGTFPNKLTYASHPTSTASTTIPDEAYIPGSNSGGVLGQMIYVAHPTSSSAYTIEDKNYVDNAVTAGGTPASTATGGYVILATPTQTGNGTASVVISGTTYLYVPQNSSFSTIASASKVPVTNGSGILDQSFLLNGNYSLGTLGATVTGVQSLTSASTTLNGTTTVTGASVFSSAPKINTISTNPSSTATYGQLTSLVPTFYQTSTITNSYNQPGGQYSATTTITVPAAVVSTLNTWLCTGSAATSPGTGALYVGATQLFSFSIPTTGFSSTLTWYSTSTGALAYRTYYASSGSNQSGGFNCTPTSIYFYQ
jgi:hypothetical protein